jgi:hypothetical protein
VFLFPKLSLKLGCASSISLGDGRGAGCQKAKLFEKIKLRPKKEISKVF